MGLFGKIVRVIIEATLIFTLLVVIPGLPPNLKFTAYNVTAPKPLTGTLSLNTHLNNAERLFENGVKGPEAFTVLNGELYSTIHGGYVVKIVGDEMIPVVKFGKDCEGWWEESKCGRPLGLRSTPDGHLYVADAYYGIFRYNVKTGETKQLITKDTLIDGRKPKLFNSLEISSDGYLYWTDSSSDVTLEDGFYTLFGDGSGRLIRYNLKTQENVVLIDGLAFANGVALSPDEDFVIVAETCTSTIHRYYLKGPKKGTRDIFVDGLPGLPDNLRPNGANGFFVPLVVARDERNPVLTQTLAPFPVIRKFVARLVALIELPFKQIEVYYPNYYSKRAAHFLGHFEMTSVLVPTRTTILEVDTQGNIVNCLHSTDGSVSSISDVIVHNGNIYLGSPYNPYLGRVKVTGSIPLQSKTQKVVPTTSPPPPTTTRTTPTTPPPTTRTTTTPPPPPPTTTTPPPKKATPTTPPPTTTTSKPSPQKPTTTTNPPTRDTQKSSKPKNTSPPPKK